MNIKPKTMEKNVLSACELCVGIVLICNVFVPVYLQRSMVSSATNTLTMTGETIELDCAQLTILKKTTTFEWSLNGTRLPLEKNKNRMSLENHDRILTITNVTSNDDGIYKCVISDNFRSDYSIFNLTVRETPYSEIHKRAVINDTLNVDDGARWNCLNELLLGTPSENVENVTWLKNGNPYFIKSGDRVLLQNRDLTLVVKRIVLEDQGIYECTAYSKFRIDRAVYNITVVDSPKTTIYNYYEANFTRYYGEKVSWSCILSTKYSVNNFSYIWYKDNTQIRPNSNDRYEFKYYDFTIDITEITREDEGSYKCFASNEHITGHLNFSLTVLDKPEIIKYDWYTSNITAITGADLTLRCELFYSSRKFQNVYQWNTIGNDSSSKKNLKKKTNEMFYLNNIIYGNSGIYYCDASNLYFIFRSNYTLNVVDSETVNNGLKYSILLFIILFSVSIMFMTCYVISLRREQALKKILDASRSKFENGEIDKWNPDLSIEEQAELLPYDKQWEFPRDKIKLGKQLGSGAFGVVFKADAIGIIDKNTTSTVAVKMIKPDSESSYTKALISELKIMIYIGKHLNVVNLLGACTEDITNNLMVIVEYCRFGNIREYLLKQRDYFINQITPDGTFDFNIKRTSKNTDYENYPNKIDKSENERTSVDPEGYLLPSEVEPVWRNNYCGDYSSGNIQPLNTHDLLCWSFQVARGMEYLSSKKILHGDLAIRNILLADDNVIKICDFGFAKTMLNNEIYKKSSGVPLPIRWMAVESISDRVFSTQSDVWSFGIVLWEIFSLAVNPYPSVQSCYDLFNRLVEGYRMEQPKYANSQLHKIMLDCWNMNPLSRPSFTDLVGYIGDLLMDDSKSHYIDLNEEYVKNFSKNPSSADYVNIFATPTYENCSTISKNNPDLTLKENASQNIENEEKLRKNRILQVTDL